MSIQLPGWVADAFNLIGLPWPGIDEDQLRAWAAHVRAYAAEIGMLSGSSKSAVAVMASSGDSSFARTLAASWERHHQLISTMRGPLEGFAVALDVAAGAVAAAKLAVIGAAVALGAEVAVTQGEALVTFGLAEAEVPAEVAVARLAVKAALQELEGQLFGMLIGKAAAEAGSVIGGTAGRLLSGGGQAVAGAVALTVDYRAMSALATALSGHAGQVETASAESWRRASSGTLAEGGPGGGWQEVARAVEQTVLQVLRQLFQELGRAFWTILKDTIDFLKRAAAALRRTDSSLAADAERLDHAGGGGFHDGGGGGSPPAGEGSPDAAGPEGPGGGKFTPPKTYVSPKNGWLTNGTYTVDPRAMAKHMPVTALPGKSRFLTVVDADKAVLDASAFADAHNLWRDGKAKVYVTNHPVGVLGRTGELTNWINVYKTRTGFVHGSPGSAP